MIVIATYNKPKLLTDLLDSMKDTVNMDEKILVVCTDPNQTEMLEFLKELPTRYEFDITTDVTPYAGYDTGAYIYIRSLGPLRPDWRHGPSPRPPAQRSTAPPPVPTRQPPAAEPAASTDTRGSDLRLRPTASPARRGPSTRSGSPSPPPDAPPRCPR